MTAKYEKMWEELGLDMLAHAGLLKVLGQFYGDIYLSQSGRLGTRISSPRCVAGRPVSRGVVHRLTRAIAC